MVTAARPSRVRGNDWRKVKVPPVEEFVPTLPVSVVIPYYEAPEALALTLAALEGQTYPSDLIEVIVVDDGSTVPLRLPAGGALDGTGIRPGRRGAGGGGKTSACRSSARTGGASGRPGPATGAPGLRRMMSWCSSTAT